MDNVTHALAGMLLADVTIGVVRSRLDERSSSPVASSNAQAFIRFRRAAVVLGIAAAEFPDSDLVYSGPLVDMGNLGYLLHHRGHTHTVVWAVISAVLLWLVARWWVARGNAQRPSTAADRPALFSRALLGLALSGTLSHLLLDYTNSYGVHPFWPFDNRWYYGDSIFIIEPWLMIAAVPPLLFGDRRTIGRVLLSLVLLLIIVASFTLGEVTRPVAVTLTLFAVGWLLAQRVIPSRRRAYGGIAAWVLVTTVFFAASSGARAQVTALVGGQTRLHDVVLTPTAADPRCFAALVITMTEQEYRVSTATVAGLPSVRTAIECREARGGDRNSLAALARDRRVAATPPFTNSAAVVWAETWSSRRAELLSLSESHCEFAAALRFMRAPAWVTGADSSVQLYDVRFGASGGFAALSLTAPREQCGLAGKWIPPWEPPTSDILR